ncbi:hypothetical protein [Aurantiacibacter sediminis]|uniref:hypothetical protein n=1 Tax=Aurantiacibacter sediminis TaxID=2793064 RepID=UPI002277B5C7|nr:hypothetical protein [Aurantiacibacter sediminis]
MIRKIGLLIGVAACGALVTSCGSDDTPTPTPTGTDTATPTPTPTSGVANFDFTADFDATSANTSAIVAYFTPEGGAEFFNDATRINGNSGIEYIATPNSVTIRFPEQSASSVFDEDDLQSNSATERVYQDGDVGLTLELPFTYILRATLETDNQDFTRDTVDGTLRSERVTAFFSTSTDDTDITSSITYTGDPLIVGGEEGVTAPNALSAPQVTFTITPGSDDVISGTITIFETVNGNQVQVADLDFSAIVGENNGFNGTLEDNANDLEGEFAGALAGPNRDEVFITFVAFNADDNRTVLGNFIGD